MVKRIAGVVALFLLTQCLSLSKNTFESTIGVKGALTANNEDLPHLNLIKNAQQSIAIEVYALSHPGMQSEILSALKRGVKLRIVTDAHPRGFGCGPFVEPSVTPEQGCPRADEFLTQFKKLGGQYSPFSYNLCGQQAKTCFEHAKFIVADRKKVLISTGNFDAPSMCLAQGDVCFRDFSFVTEDKRVVDTITQIFENDFLGKPYSVTNIVEAVRARLTVSPVSANTLFEFISSAQQSVEVQTQYITDPQLIRVLETTAQKLSQMHEQESVQKHSQTQKLNIENSPMHITLSSTCLFLDKASAKLPRESIVNSTYERLEKAGAKIKMFTQFNRLVPDKLSYNHAKVIIVDGKRAWVGSTNGSTNALFRNREVGIFIDDKTLVQKLQDYLKHDFNSLQNEDWQANLYCQKEFAN